VIERSLAGITGALESALFGDEIARAPGLLQALDARVKLVSVLALLLAVSLSRNLAVIFGLYLFALVLAWRSRVPLGFFVKRVWLFLPFFTGIIALPALFITPGPALIALPFGLTVTQTGLQSALFLLLRVGTSVSYAVLLVLTTPWTTVLKALAGLRVPDVVIVVLGMTHRYLFLLLHTANEMFLARQSRLIARVRSAGERRWVAGTIGVLLGKSFHLSNEVYLAMLSRGLHGAPRTMATFRLRPGDWALGAALVALAVVAVALGRAA
jgi:cobalt ECF transporter T component CbiQ